MYFEKCKLYLSVLFAVSIFIGCGSNAQGESHISSSEAKAANPYLNSYDAVSYPEKIAIFKGDKKISVIKSENPNIERWGFIGFGNQITVRSRSDDGPAVLELFEVETGTLLDRVVVSPDIKGGKPPWAILFLK